ncbi:MAG: phospholipase A [Nibricoccus sp.]
MKRCVLLVFMTVLLSGRSYAQAVTAALIVPEQGLTPGTRVNANIALLNPSGQPARVAFPITLTGRLTTEGKQWPLVIEIKTMPVPVIAAGSFSSATCSFVVPKDALGRLVLEIDEPAVRAVVDISQIPSSSTVTENEKEVTAPLSDPAKVPALSQFHRVFAENISTHLPIYFLFGPKKPAAKYQFSFKYRIVGDRSPAGTLSPPLRGLYFGYTQRSVWDITSYSSPFYDTSYMPELMWESLAPAPANPGFLGFRWLGYQASVQHESNGRDGNNSRSLNLVYVRPIFSRDFGKNWSLLFSPKLFYYIDNLSDNPDLERYRGYGEYMLTWARRGSWSLSALGRVGSHFDKASVQLDLSFPLRIAYGNFASYFLVQYFDGYGESLLSYNQKAEMIRAGFSLVR